MTSPSNSDRSQNEHPRLIPQAGRDDRTRSRSFFFAHCILRRLKHRPDQSKGRGAAVVEFAVALPLLLGVLIGMIDFGMIMNEHQALQEATRTVARAAVVGSAPTASCDDSGMVASAGSETLGLVCGIKNSVLSDDVRVKLSFDGFEEGEQLVLCSMAAIDSILGVHEVVADGTAKARITMRIENTDYDTYNIVEEPPLDGSDWSWCA